MKRKTKVNSSMDRWSWVALTFRVKRSKTPDRGQGIKYYTNSENLGVPTTQNLQCGSYNTKNICSLQVLKSICQCCTLLIKMIPFSLLQVNNKEMVSMVREPRNPYDVNAIKIENVWGEQVGHLKRELAKPLAHILDNKWARLEGWVIVWLSCFLIFTTHMITYIIKVEKMWVNKSDLLRESCWLTS